MDSPSSLFRGSIVALPTPFAGDELDLPTLLHLIDRQVEARSNAIVVAGSTGEGAALDKRERLTLFEYAAGAAGGRIPVIAGIGCSATREALCLAEAAESVGVQALLVTTPSYNRPSPLGLERHFGAVSRCTSLPIALYNVPARSGVDLTPESVARIAEACPNVVAIKDASGSLERLDELLALNSVAVLTGDDHLLLKALELGVAGVVGVVANLVPGRVGQIVREHGLDPANSKALAQSLEPLIAALHCDSNPGPVKHALECLGLMQADLRLPLVPVSSTHAKLIHDALVQSDLLEF